MKAQIFKNLHSRRVFLSRILKAGIVLNLPLLEACIEKTDTFIISAGNKHVLKDTLYFLWPDDGMGPSIAELKVYEYFLWFFSDPNVDPEEKEYLFKGMNWVEETAVEEFNYNYVSLNSSLRTELMNIIAGTEWGESWFSKLINLIIEAIFSDPVYGSNPNGIGYKWFEHNPGYPRPDQNNNYGELLKRKKENIIISAIDQLS